MPAKNFDYRGVGGNSYLKKVERKKQLSNNKDVLFQNRLKTGQRCSLMFQTDHQEEWIDALLNFKAENQEVRCTACLDKRSGIIVVQGSRKGLALFEAEFDHLFLTTGINGVKLDAANPDKQENPGEGRDDDDDDDKGVITVVVVEEFRYRGETGRRQREALRHLSKEP